MASNEGYTAKLVAAFTRLQALPASTTSNYNSSLNFDGANGVGGVQMAVMATALQPSLQLKLHNNGEAGGVLNYMCGADHVKVRRETLSTFGSDTPDHQDQHIGSVYKFHYVKYSCFISGNLRFFSFYYIL